MSRTSPGSHATPRRDPPFRRPSRSARAARSAGDVRDSHGGRRLATGITIASGIVILAHLSHAASLAVFFPPGRSPWPAWIALAAVIAVGVVSRIIARTMPDWLYIALLLGLAAPVWLDVAATAGQLHLGVMPTAAAAAGAVLMPVAAIRGTRVPLAVASLIAIVLGAEALLQATGAGRATVVAVAVAASAVLPVLLVTFALTGFRRLVGRELDLSLVQSTIGTSRSAVGMRASEELAQLDFDAENLLEDVGSGRIAIPLPPEVAERAGELAARLRVRLIEGRTDTWLRHAVTESAYLSEHVSVEDPSGSAGLLSQTQRDGLLLALWLLVAQHKRSAAPVSVHVSVRDSSDAERTDALAFDLAIQVSGLPKRRVDPGTWDALDSVGDHTMMSAADGFRIDVTCAVDPSAYAGSTAARAAAQSRGS